MYMSLYKTNISLFKVKVNVVIVDESNEANINQI